MSAPPPSQPVAGRVVVVWLVVWRRDQAPMTNALTFAISIVVGRMLGEPARSTWTHMGLALIVAGIGLCIFSKQ